MFKKGSLVIVNLNVKSVPERTVVIPLCRKFIFCLFHVGILDIGMYNSCLDPVYGLRKKGFKFFVKTVQKCSISN